MSGWIAFLEMVRKPQDLPEVKEGFKITLAAKDWRTNREWYRRVGANWQWTDRSKRTEAEWIEYVDNENQELWVASFEGEDCGFFELSRETEGTRLALLGLEPDYIGKGLGSSLLNAALEQAWKGDPSRVFLDTCSQDHPNGLRNYLRHGFRIIRTEFADPRRS